jgi:hypothetical protein
MKNPDNAGRERAVGYYVLRFGAVFRWQFVQQNGRHPFNAPLIDTLV